MRPWVNGRLVEPDDAMVNVLDHGFTVGDGVFETIKVVDGTPFALSRHLKRLTYSARGLGLAEPDVAAIESGCAAVTADIGPGPALHRMRITYTAGVAPPGSDRGDEGTTTVVTLAPVAPRPETAQVAVVPWPRNERGALSGLKTTSYAENVVALAHAKRLGASEALFADTQGRLSEGTGSNVFVVVDGTVLTPSLSAGGLAGVTRDLVLEWTDATEAELPIAVLDDVEEVFLTSTTRDVQAVDLVLRESRRRDLVSAPGRLTRDVAAVFAKRSQEDVDP